jgi:DNA polymerase III delta prime subunit
MSLIFVEKYVEAQPHRSWTQDCAPKSLSEVVGNTMIVETVMSFLNSNHLPNLLFCGPNGCGKTTVAKLLVNAYLQQYAPHACLEIIGSIHRGKNVVTEKGDKKKVPKGPDNPNINHFIHKKIVLPPDKCRLVLVYDFDCMTTEAQMALRRIIELYAHKVRFIFICNNLNEIIEAVQSRTLILKFQPISTEQITDHLKVVTQIKNVSIDEDILDTIGIMSNGDLKQAINYLQVFSHSNERGLVNFYHLFNVPSITNMTQFVACCLDGKQAQAFEILDHLIDNGYNVSDILDVLIKVLVFHKSLYESQRAFFIEETIRIICINEQSSSIVHLYKLATTILKNHEHLIR